MQHETQTIVDLETRFWQSMVDKNAKVAKAMIADQCLVTGPNGTMKINPDKYEEMTRDGKWTLDKFKLSDVDIVFPTEDVAVIAYKVHETGTLDRKPMDMTCVDASTWVRDGKEWKCTLHTETILEDAATAAKH